MEKNQSSTFASLFTLVLVPIMYTIIEKSKNKINYKFRKNNPMKPQRLN